MSVSIRSHGRDLREFSFYDAQALMALSARLKLNRPPFILLAGWMDTNISEEVGALN